MDDGMALLGFLALLVTIWVCAQGATYTDAQFSGLTGTSASKVLTEIRKQHSGPIVIWGK